MKPPELSFTQLSPDAQNALFSFYKQSLESSFKESRNAAWELAKFLFTANTGAAAGMFVLVRSSAGNTCLIAAFFTFCSGVFFVGTAYFFGAVSFAQIALKYEEGVLKVLRGELLPSDFTEQRRRDVRGRMSKLIPLFGTLSFLCLLLGGGLAVKPFISKIAGQPSVATKSIQNVSFTNSIDPKSH